MDNRNLYDSLRYGTIIKLKSTNEKLNESLFFVDYVDETKIKLVSDTLEKNTFILNEEGGLDTIDEIVVVHESKGGYAVLNKLLPGKILNIVFSDNVTSIQAEIIKLQYDMITMKTADNVKLYIDFEYRGLQEKYNISEITIIPAFQSIAKDDFNDVELDDDYIEAEEGLTFSLEQQFNDYIEKAQVKTKDKRQILQEISKYSLLLNEYTDLDQGEKKISLPNNQVLHSIMKLNRNLVYPMTSYADKDLYIEDYSNITFTPDGEDTDTVDRQYSVQIQKLDQSQYKSEYEKDNIHFTNTKRHDYHKKIRVPENTRGILVNKVNNVLNNKPYIYSVQKDVTKEISHDSIQLDEDTKLVIDGIVFPNINSIHRKSQQQLASSLLSKSIEQDNPTLGAKPSLRKLKESDIDNKEIFHSKQMNYHPLTSKDTSFKDYISKLKYNINDLQSLLSEHDETNLYSHLNKLSLFDVSKLRSDECSYIQKLVKEKVQKIKKELHTYRRELKSRNSYEPFTNTNIDEPLFRAIIDKYKISQGSHKHFSEIFDETLIDNMELFMFSLRENNSVSNIDFNDEEISNYITQLTAEINGQVDVEKVNDVNYVKVYESKIQLMDDFNKVILRNVQRIGDVVDVFDPLQEIYNKLVTNTQYTGDIKEFVSNIEILLELMFDQNMSQGEIEASVFVDQSDQENILNFVIEEIIRHKVRKLEKCYVKDENEYYIYNGVSWDSVKEHGNELGKKKMLKVKNSMDEISQVKTKIVNDFVIELINKNERDTDLKDQQNNQTKFELMRRLVLFKNNKHTKSLVYNSQKREYDQLFLKSDYLSTSNFSPFSTLLYNILAIPELTRKYNLIQKFISLFTTDNGDGFWYYCIQTNTKLVPKYLNKLASAYLVYDNHDIVMNEICLQEGYLSEEGDAWIHKESGFIIRNIDFDTNYGYDENGFQLQINTSVNELDIALEQGIDKKNDGTVNFDTEDRKTQQVLRLVQETTLSIMKVLGMSFRSIDNQQMIYQQIAALYFASRKKSPSKADKTKSNDENKKRFYYAIVSFLLIYSQSNKIQVKRTFPGCNLSFEGYPLDENKDALGGISYLSCLLIKLAKRNEKLGGASLSKFKSSSEDEIQKELLNYISTYALKQDYIQDMIWDGRIKRESSQTKSNTVFKPPPLKRFRPQQTPIKTVELEELPSSSSKINKQYELDIAKLSTVNFKIQEIINSLIKNKEPILKTQFEEPFLVNFCCNNEDFLLEQLPETKTKRDEIANLLKLSKDLQEITKHQESKYFKGTTLRTSVFETTQNVEEPNTAFYDKSTIFLFISKLLNFNNKKEIPTHLKQFNINKPSDEFHKELSQMKNPSIKDQIKLLEDKGYKFDQEVLINIMNQHYETIAREDKSTDVVDEVEVKSPAFDIFSDEFMNTKNTGEIIDEFDNNITLLKKNYQQFLDRHIISAKKRKMMTHMKKWGQPETDEEKELWCNQLYNINYALISAIPKKLLHGADAEEIISKQWEIAPAHADVLKQNHISYLSSITKLDEHDAYRQTFSNISEHKDILNVTKFNNNLDSKRLFLLYLFYKLMNVYISGVETNLQSTVDVNEGIIGFVDDYLNINSFTYESAKIKLNQLKKAEKHEKTEYLRKMKPQEREAEKQKMAYKLGEWAYGNQKRVFKYYRELYDEDTKRADKIKEISQELYSDVITSEGVGSNTTLTTLEEEGAPPAEYDIALVPDDDGAVYDKEGNELDDFE